MIILFVYGQVSTIRQDVPVGCRRRCRAGRIIAGRLESIAGLLSGTSMMVVVLRAIRALGTLVRFVISRSSIVPFLCIPLLVVELVDPMCTPIECFTIRAEVRGIRELKKTTAHINISKRILRLKLVNDIVNRRGESHKKMTCYGFIGL